MQRLRRSIAILSLSGLLGAPAAVAAAGFPDKPVRMVVAFAAGGPTDVLARIVATGMARSLGQQVIVDNKAGGGGVIGTREAAKAAPDGYTILFAGDASLTVQPQLSKTAGFDPKKDFTPLRIVAAQNNVLVAHRASGITDVPTLIARAKARPGSLTFGSAGNGSPSHLIGTLFESQAGVDLLHVPYRGAAPAMSDLIGGQVNLMFVGMPVALLQKDRQELVMLAVTGDKRAPALPGVPTFAEAGVGSLGAETAIWWGVVAPAGLPPEASGKLDAALRAALDDPEVRSGLAAQGVDTLNLDAGTLARWVDRDLAKWGRLIQAKKVTAD